MKQWVFCGYILWITVGILWITFEKGLVFEVKWWVFCGKLAVFGGRPVDKLGKTAENLRKTY